VCSVKGCKARIYAQYYEGTRKQQDEEEPVLNKTTLQVPEDHTMKDGICHPIEVGLRLLEEFRRKVKEAVMADPTRPVGQTYEAQIAEMTSSLQPQEKDEFISLCPTLRSMERNLYKRIWHRLCRST